MKTRIQTKTLPIAIALVIGACAPLASYADKPSTPVSVVNDVTNPVPVVQVGTTTVNLSSSNNTVIVANPTNKPVLVRSVDSGAVQPITVHTNFDGPDNGNAAFARIYTVPTGKRLVIEYIAFDCLVPTGQKLLSTQVQYPTQQIGSQAFLNAVPVATGNLGPNFTSFQGSQLVKGYVDPGAVNAGSVKDTQTGHWEVAVTMTGYLVDVP